MMEIRELIPMLTDEQKRELADILFDKALKEVKEMDVRPLVEREIREAISYAFNNAVDYDFIGNEVSDLIVEEIKRRTK